MFRSLLVFGAALVMLRADDNQFVRPKIGFAFDASLRQIRPLSGTPGAALAVAGVPLDFDLDRALISSALSFAIAAPPDSDHLKLIRLFETGPAVTPIPDSLNSYDLGSLSRIGKAAIFYQSGCRCVQVVSGLPDAPQVVRTITLAQDAAVVQALAVADDARAFAIATRTGDSGEISLYGPDSHVSIARPADALGFSPDGLTLAVADAPAKTISILRDANLVEIATERDGISNPAGVAFASSNRMVVADRESRVHVIAAETGRVVAVDCSCKPSAVETMSIEDTFRISDIASGALWIVQLTGSSGRTIFIPVDRSESRQSAEDAK